MESSLFSVSRTGPLTQTLSHLTRGTLGIFETLTGEIPEDMIIGVTHHSLSAASQLQARHKDANNFYFDSIHLALSLEVDGQIVSSDRFFDRVAGIRRIPLESL